MNKKIKELLKQSGAKYGNTSTAYSAKKWISTDEEMEKFAELIVAECIKELEIAKKCDPYNGDLYDCDTNSSLDYVIDALKDDFGIK